MNPKDYKVPLWFGKTAVEGSDVSGTIAQLGPDETEFAVGDRSRIYPNR